MIRYGKSLQNIALQTGVILWRLPPRLAMQSRHDYPSKFRLTLYSQALRRFV